MRIPRVAPAIVALASVCCLSSCGTIASLADKNASKTFGGVIYESTVMIPTTNHGMWVGWIFIPDLPLSLALDILLLPVTIVWDATRSEGESAPAPD